MNQILNLLIELQEEQNKSTAKLLNYNYYDVIAFVYEKLGQKKNAEKAMLDYEQLEKVRSEEVHSIIKK